MRFPTMWHVRPAKPQISLGICTVWSEPLLVAWIFYDYQVIDRAAFGVSKLKRRQHRPVWVYLCQNATLLEITCRSSFGPRRGKPVFGGLQTTQAQTSLRIRAVWSAPLLFLLGKVSYVILLQVKFQFSRFETRFVGNPEDRFSRDEAHLYLH